ncbi:hypothetical protein [Nocardia sp. NPDC051570]|uniref:hypothetical protein n=1 Tax=Nocardia sp. NPDC051570 TaxID=3364324 RepID=UPI0037AD762B
MDATISLDRSARTALRTAARLVAGYVVINAVTFGAVVALRDHAEVVNSAVWVRTSIVLGTSALMLRFAVRAESGGARAYLRLRIVSAIMLVAIIVIVASPGPFPGWLRIEQSVCGVVLLAVVVTVNRARVRAAFTAR